MQTRRFTREEILKIFKKSNFPNMTLSKERVDKLKDLLFNEISESPLSKEKKINFSSCFMKDQSYDNPTFKPRSASTFKSSSTSNYTKKYNYEEVTQKEDNIIMKGQMPTSSVNSRKVSHNSTEANKCIWKTNEFLLCRENSICIADKGLLEFIPQPHQVNLNKDLSFLVNYANKEEKKENLNNKMIIKGRKFSECSDSSGKFLI